MEEATLMLILFVAGVVAGAIVLIKLHPSCNSISFDSILYLKHMWKRTHKPSAAKNTFYTNYVVRK